MDTEMNAENVAKVNTAIEEFRRGGAFLLQVLPEQSVCNHFVMILKAHYGVSKREDLYHYILDITSRMVTSVFVVPFPGGNCYDGTILEGGEGPAQY